MAATKTKEETTEKKSRKKMPSPEPVEQVTNSFNLKVIGASAQVKGDIRVKSIADNDDGAAKLKCDVTLDVDLATADELSVPAQEALVLLAKETARITEGKHDMKLTIRRDYGAIDLFMTDFTRDKKVEVRGEVKGDPRLSFAEGDRIMRLKVTLEVSPSVFPDLVWMKDRDIEMSVAPLQLELV